MFLNKINIFFTLSFLLGKDYRKKTIKSLANFNYKLIFFNKVCDLILINFFNLKIVLKNLKLLQQIFKCYIFNTIYCSYATSNSHLLL